MTISPIFDQLARRPASRPLDRAATPVFASVATTSDARLSTTEREVGTAIGRLIVHLLDEPRRRPRHR